MRTVTRQELRISHKIFRVGAGGCDSRLANTIKENGNFVPFTFSIFELMTN